MSIFPLLLLVGVAVSRHIFLPSDTSGLQPIVTRSEERRICAELCMSGLGGSPCGDDCVDITPQGLPLQSAKANATVNFSASTRHNSCNILCDNNLGYPLCACSENIKKNTKTDFVAICSHFCINYDYRLYGCQTCNLYKNSSVFSLFSLSIPSQDEPDQMLVNWDLWCQKMCQGGDGGAACNCDLLPMSLQL